MDPGIPVRLGEEREEKFWNWGLVRGCIVRVEKPSLPLGMLLSMCNLCLL